MANETNTPSGEVSEEGKPNSTQSSSELSVGSDRARSLSQETFAPPWLRMDPELSRTVLAKTEEELLGALSALMRNRIEHEKAQRGLANTILEIDQAKQEVATVKRQVMAAEDELQTRLADHERVVDDITEAQSRLQAEETKYLEFQDQLNGIRKEIEEAQKEKETASAQLDELQREQQTARSEIESLKNQISALQGEQQNILKQVEPLRKDIDERLNARETIIQQIVTMERHLAELTSTRDIRTSAQRIALVGRGTESMRGEIQRLKGEIERIEKERVRLANERDRVESEFAGLQDRLSNARSTYAETLEKLDEARGALAITEKEHDEAVSKLEQIHRKEEEAAPVTSKSIDSKHPEPEVPVEAEALLEDLAEAPAEEKLAQELPVSDEIQIVPEPVDSKPPEESVPKVPVPAREPVLAESVQEVALPLLMNKALPAVISSWDSYRLESEFFTEETLDGRRVANLVSELPGIEHVLVVRQRGAVLAGDLPARLSDQFRTPGRDYERLFNAWPDRRREQRSTATQTFTFQVGDEFLTVTQAEDIFLIVSHERPKLNIGVEEKLAVVVEELTKMYPKEEQGTQGPGVPR
jgi:predicted  nucleic acid-binding Zn-ribbon protein